MGRWPRDEAAARARGKSRTPTVHDRGVVLLRGTRARATRSGVKRVLATGHDDWISNPVFRRSRRQARCSPRVRKRSLRSARGPLVGCGDPGQVPRDSSSVEAVVACLSWARTSGVIAVGDRPTVLAAHVSAALGLPGNSPSVGRSQSKQAGHTSRVRGGRFVDTGLSSVTCLRAPVASQFGRLIRSSSNPWRCRAARA